MARDITTVVIGGGHAGLAMSQRLSARSIDHVVLERGEVANTWKTERWDSLRLLTPNWQSRLPGFAYEGPDPDGYMTMPEVISFIERYAEVADGPGADRHHGQPGSARAERIPRSARAKATGVPRPSSWRPGRAMSPIFPPFAADVPAGIDTFTPMTYRNPRATRRRWRPGRRRLGDGHPTRRRDPSIGPAGHARRRRPRAGTAGLPRPRHPALDGRHRHDERALRRGRRHRQAAPAPVVAGRRYPGSGRRSTSTP